MHRRLALLGMALVAALGACSVVEAMLDTEEALERNGYRDAEVGLESSNGVDSVEVTYASAPELAADGGHEEAARIVWDTLPLRFDVVEVQGAVSRARS